MNFTNGNVAKHGSLHDVLGSASEAVSTDTVRPNAVGVVLGTQPENGLVAISLGEADGVQKGQLFDAIRDDRRVAQLRIVFVRKNNSVGKIMDESNTAEIQKGEAAQPWLNSKTEP